MLACLLTATVGCGTRTVDDSIGRNALAAYNREKAYLEDLVERLRQIEAEAVDGKKKLEDRWTFLKVHKTLSVEEMVAGRKDTTKAKNDIDAQFELATAALRQRIAEQEQRVEAARRDWLKR